MTNIFDEHAVRLVPLLYVLTTQPQKNQDSAVEAVSVQSILNALV